jgi:hypothetical protein
VNPPVVLLRPGLVHGLIASRSIRAAGRFFGRLDILLYRIADAASGGRRRTSSSSFVDLGPATRMEALVTSGAGRASTLRPPSCGNSHQPESRA